MARWDADEIIQAYESSEQDRRSLDGQYDLIERFVMPGRGRFYEDDMGGNNAIDWSAREIYDSTAASDAQMLAANIHGNLTSDSLDWFGITFEQDELNEDQESAEWLEAAASLEKKSIQESNFGREVPELYLDGVGFGTAVLLHDEQPGPNLQWNGHKFASQMMRQCYFEEDFDGNPVSLFLKRTYSPRQLANKFGAQSLPDSVRKKLESPETALLEDEELVRVIYLDVSKKDADVSGILSPSARPYVGRYVLVNGHHFVGEEESWYEFPGYILRWARTAGSKYGFSPAMIALGDILTLQELVQMIRGAEEKTVDPPMKSTRRGIIGDLDQQAAGLTMVRDMDGLAPLLPPGSYRINSGWDDVQDLRRKIDRLFFIDQLQLKESPEMTATEVRVRYELMQRTLGPTLGRIQNDFLDPLVKRSFWMMARKGAFPKMPDKVRKLKGTLKIEYRGPLAKAQKLGEVDGIIRWLGLGADISQMPGAEEIIDVPDYDAAYTHIGDILGVPKKLVRSEVERNKRRKARKAQQQNQEQAAMTESASGTVKNIADAKMKMAQANSGGE